MSQPQAGQNEPRKAYLVKYKVVNECEAVVYADNAREALAKFEAVDPDTHMESTGIDYRLGSPKVKRFPSEDR